MLGIFGKKSDHPLADIRSAQQVLEDIPKNDALNAVQELTGWIEVIAEMADELRVDHQCAVLRMFDETAQQFVRKLLRDYFTAQALSKFQESRLWTMLNEFYSRSEFAHYVVLTRYRNGDRGAAGVKPELAVLNARGIAALTGRLKMAAARYALVEPALWQHLSESYGHAEMNGYQNDAVPLYAGVSGSTSVTQEFAALLVWYGVSAGKLNPLQEHITERLVAYASDRLAVYDRYNSNGIFVFDLAQPTPPMRIAADATLHPSLRFLVAGDTMAKFGELGEILDKGLVPDSLHFHGASYDAELVRETLHRLTANLTQPSSTRRNPRRKVNVNLKVANGLFNMLEKADLNLNFDTDAGELWDVEDISLTGFRSVVPLVRADAIEIGALIGSKPENVQHWGAGIVRRLSRDENNNLHVGVEVLSTHISGVLLSGHATAPSREMQVAIYLNRPADISGEVWLLMKPDTFSRHRSLNMELGGKKYLLLPLALVESGYDFDLARFRSVEQEQDAAVG